MAIKELVDQVRSKLDEETLSKVGAVLEEIRAEVSNMSDSLSAANNESKNRKIKIRELETQLEDRDVEVSTLNKKIESFNTKPLEQERDKYRDKYNNFLNTQKDAFISFFNQASKVDAWTKVKDEYDVPDEKDGKPDWEAVKPEQLENNISKMLYHQKLGLFETQHKPDPNTGKKFINGKPVLTSAEYMEIRKQYGPNSPEAKEAMAQVKR